MTLLCFKTIHLINFEVTICKQKYIDKHTMSCNVTLDQKYAVFIK